MSSTVVVVAVPGDVAAAEGLAAALRVEGVVAVMGDVDASDVGIGTAPTARRDGPIGVAAFGTAAEAAVHAAADDARVRSIALFGAPLTVAAVDVVSRWPEVALLAAADPEDRAGLAGALDAYLASAHPASDLLVGRLDAAASSSAAVWLRQRLAEVATVDEVVLHTDDGWEVHGTRWLPSRATADEPVAGVVLLHSGRSDRAVFARLERGLAERGVAVLNIDWRGRGRTTNRGSYFDLDPDERAAGWRDAAAAVDHLAGLPEVDAHRLGAVGVVHGAEHAAGAAVRDPRVRALVLLTGYRPASDAEAAHLTSGAVRVLYVTSRDHTITTAAMRGLHDASPPGSSRYVEYAGGAIGYQLFELDHGLEPAIVDWLSDTLR